jgi:hypothetical protein
MQSPGELRTDQATAEASYVEEDTGWLDPVTGDVLMQVMTELANMTSMLRRAAARRRIGDIQGLVRALLHQVAQLIMAGEIDPWTRLRMTPDDLPVSRRQMSCGSACFPCQQIPSTGATCFPGCPSWSGRGWTRSCT